MVRGRCTGDGMLAALKRWFAHSPSAASPGETADPTAFRPGLIPSLHADHEELLRLFADLERAGASSDPVACRSALDRFTRLLQDHLLTENRHLYGYFSRHPDPNPEVARQVEAMSADMMRVGKILHRFITTYTRATWTVDLHERMRHDLRGVGEVLAHRIHEEESVLYPLYRTRAH
jgi:hypothetical protein